MKYKDTLKQRTIYKNDANNASLIHFSALINYLIPIWGVIGPLIFWSLKKDQSRFLDDQGRRAINFNLSFTLYAYILGTTSVLFFFNKIDNLSFNFLKPNHYHYDSLTTTFSQFDFNLFHFIGITSIVALIELIRVVLVCNAGLQIRKGNSTYYPLSINFLKINP
jgi:hypothetical protein